MSRKERRFVWPDKQWEYTAPAEMGFDAQMLERADEYASANLPKLSSLLLIRRGYLLWERYYNGADRDSLMDVRSVTKSFTGAAVGLLWKEGLIGSPDDTIDRYLPEEAMPVHSEAGSVSIRELLTMTSGLYWKTGKKLGEAYIRRLHNSKDWLRFILRLPVVPELKGKFLYRSTDSHLLSILTTRVSGLKMASYLQQRMFGELGISLYDWPEDPQGHTAGHVFLQMTARDLAKLGLLYLAGGRWRTHEILPERWVTASLSPQTEGMPFFGSYGYQWWSSSIGGRKAAYALGHGGNFIIVLPELESVVVALSDPRVSRWRDPRRLVEKFILPAYSGEYEEDCIF